MSDSLWPHGLQHTRLPCPSPTPGTCSNSCPSSRWFLSTISSSVVPFSSCPQTFPTSGSFPVSQFFTWGSQKDWSFSFSISPSNEYSGLIFFRMDWLDLLVVQGTLKSLQHHSWTASILQHSAFSVVQISHPYMTTGKTIALTRWTFVGKVMSLLFNTLCRFAYNKLSKEQVSFSFIAAVTICSDFGAQKNKVSTVEHILILISSALDYIFLHISHLTLPKFCQIQLLR